MDMRYVLTIGFKILFAVVLPKHLSACIHLSLGVKVSEKKLPNFICLLLFSLYNIKTPVKLQCFILHDSRSKHLPFLALTGLLCSASYYLSRSTAFKNGHRERLESSLGALVI